MALWSPDRSLRRSGHAIACAASAAAIDTYRRLGSAVLVLIACASTPAQPPCGWRPFAIFGSPAGDLVLVADETEARWVREWYAARGESLAGIQYDANLPDLADR